MQAIFKALNHVKDWFPEVYKVFYDEDGHWLYFNSDGSHPNFQMADVDFDLLHEAADEAYVIAGFPCEFVL